MNNKTISCAVLFVVVLGCTGSNPRSDQKQSQNSQPPSSGKKIQVKGIGKLNFPNGDTALVMDYETEIPIDDMESLRKEVDAIWARFQKDVEKAGVKSGVIRATHYEGDGFFRRGKGFGFVFEKAPDGKWRLVEDDGKK